MIGKPVSDCMKKKVQAQTDTRRDTMNMIEPQIPLHENTEIVAPLDWDELRLLWRVAQDPKALTAIEVNRVKKITQALKSHESFAELCRGIEQVINEKK